MYIRLLVRVEPTFGDGSTGLFRRSQFRRLFCNTFLSYGGTSIFSFPICDFHRFIRRAWRRFIHLSSFRVGLVFYFPFTHFSFYGKKEITTTSSVEDPTTYTIRNLLLLSGCERDEGVRGEGVERICVRGVGGGGGGGGVFEGEL